MGDIYQSQVDLDGTVLTAGQHDVAADPSGILVSWVSAAAGKDHTVTIDGTGATNTPDVMAVRLYRLRDLLGEAIGHPLGAVTIFLEVTSAPSSTSDMVVVAGLVDGDAVSLGGTWQYVGLHYDEAAGPDLRYSRTTTITDTIAIAGHVAALMHVPGSPGAAGGTRPKVIIADALDSAGDSLGQATAPSTVYTGDVYVWIGVGNSSGSGGATDAVTLRVRVRAIGAPSGGYAR